MTKLSEAWTKFMRLKAEGFNPKLLWCYRRQDWYVAYIWYPTMAGHYSLTTIER
jgi:hypothetical protein